MENAQNKIQNAVDKYVNDLDRNHLRKMQARMFRCSAECCENQAFTADEVQRCAERCGTGLNECTAHMQNELQSFQNRLQRCAMDCQDRLRDKLPANATEADAAKHRPDLEACMTRCVDTHMQLLPAMFDRVKSSIKRHQ